MEYLGQSPDQIMKFFALFILLLGLLFLFKYQIIQILEKYAQKTKSPIDDAVLNSLNAINKYFIFYLAFFIAAALAFDFNQHVFWVLKAIFIFNISYYIAAVLFNIIDTYIESLKDKLKSDKTLLTVVPSIFKLLKIFIASIILLTALSQLGLNVNAFIAGIGIGGVAIAFALQKILADIFSSLVILLDKPFFVGDFITTSTACGVVEGIGLKTTRIRALSGELLVIPNHSIISSKVSNYSDLTTRRVHFSLPISYASSDKSDLVVSIAKDIIEKNKNLSFVRCVFNEFGEHSINFDLYFVVESDDFDLFIESKESVYKELLAEFKKNNIEFGFLKGVVR